MSKERDIHCDVSPQRVRSLQFRATACRKNDIARHKASLNTDLRSRKRKRWI